MELREPGLSVSGNTYPAMFPCCSACKLLVSGTNIISCPNGTTYVRIEQSGARWEYINKDSLPRLVARPWLKLSGCSKVDLANISYYFMNKRVSNKLSVNRASGCVSRPNADQIRSLGKELSTYGSLACLGR